MLSKFRLILLILFLQANVTYISGQVPEFSFDRNTDKVEFPFEFYYNYFILKIRIYGVFELKFIVDTGAEYSMITQKEVADLLGIQYSRKIKVLGADQKTILTAFVGSGVDMEVGELNIKNNNILVLSEGFTQYSFLSNLNISGIIGGDILSRYVVKIDFKKKVLVLNKPSSWHKPKGYDTLDIEINKSKPYLSTIVQLKEDSVFKIKLLLDTGAGLPLLLIKNTLPKEILPDSLLTGRLGLGLGGFIEGIMGRIKKLQIGNHYLKNVMTSFQYLEPSTDSTNFYQKNGIIGTDIMRIFDWYIDYPNEICYFKPNKDFKKAPQYDKSGIILMAYGTYLNKYIVLDITPGSAAFYADVRKGDIIRSVNHIPKSILGYLGIVKILSRNEGEKIHLGIKRGGKNLEKRLILKNML